MEKDLYDYCQECINARSEQIEKGEYAYMCTLELNDDDYIYNEKKQLIGCKYYEYIKDRVFQIYDVCRLGVPIDNSDNQICDYFKAKEHNLTTLETKGSDMKNGK